MFVGRCSVTAPLADEFQGECMAERRFRCTPGGVCSLGLHLVWCPKYRRRVLGGRVAVRCRELLGQIAAEHGGAIVAAAVMPDHVHLFVRVGPTDAPASVVRAFKGRTARVLRHEFPYVRRLRNDPDKTPHHTLFTRPDSPDSSKPPVPSGRADGRRPPAARRTRAPRRGSACLSTRAWWLEHRSTDESPDQITGLTTEERSDRIKVTSCQMWEIGF